MKGFVRASLDGSDEKLPFLMSCRAHFLRKNFGTFPTEVRPFLRLRLITSNPILMIIMIEPCYSRHCSQLKSVSSLFDFICNLEAIFISSTKPQATETFLKYLFKHII